MDVNFFEEHFNVELNLDLESFSEVSTDSRTVKKNALFIALSGENFDGNKFAEAALGKGAAVALVSDSSIKGSVVCVKDTLVAFQSLGTAWQKHVNPKVIGITGSNGKTTSKFFTAQVLKNFFKVCYSPQSFNNEIGVPITQSLIKSGDEVLVAEIGTSAKGEIKALTDMVLPEICVVTTVGPSHLEGFGTVENVAIEKSEIYNSKNIKKAIFNLDNPFTKKMYDEFQGEKISFSTSDERADVYLKPSQKDLDVLSLSGTVQGVAVETEVAVFGEFNVYNIMAALSVGLCLDLEVSKLIKALKNVETPWGRAQVFKTPSGGKLLFDGYNSNLQSMEALFESVKPLIENGIKVDFILGEMLELGDASDQMHEDLGFRVGELNPHSISFIGSSFKLFKKGVLKSKFSKNLVISDTYEEKLAIKVQSMLDPMGIAVLKGSRGMRLERFFNVLGVDLPEK